MILGSTFQLSENPNEISRRLPHVSTMVAEFLELTTNQAPLEKASRQCRDAHEVLLFLSL